MDLKMSPLGDERLKDIQVRLNCSIQVYGYSNVAREDVGYLLAEIKRLRAGEDTQMLDWLGEHPESLVYRPSSRDMPSGWVWRDDSKESHYAQTLRAALRAACGMEKGVKPWCPERDAVITLAREIEMHCPCGARSESSDTHPHMPWCPVYRLLKLLGVDAVVWEDVYDYLKSGETKPRPKPGP